MKKIKNYLKSPLHKQLEHIANVVAVIFAVVGLIYAIVLCDEWYNFLPLVMWVIVLPLSLYLGRLPMLAFAKIVESAEKNCNN